MKCNFTKIIPAFKEQLNVIAVSSSNEYAAYLGVYLKSLIDNSSDLKKYDIIVFSKSFSEYNKNKIKVLEKRNVSIRFCNPSEYFINANLYIAQTAYKEECYYRIVAPNILSLYNKILFTDLDLIVRTDILDIFDISIGKNIIGCSTEPYWYVLYDRNEKLNSRGYSIKSREYSNKYLNNNNPFDYYNTGVCLIDVKRYIEFNGFEKILECLKVNNFIHQEQDAINVVFKGKIFTLPEVWNFELTAVPLNDNNTLTAVKYIDNYNRNEINAKIIHFLGIYKPWFNPYQDKVYYWWNYARVSPFYENIILLLLSYKIEENNKLIYIDKHKIFFFYKKIEFLLKSKFKRVIN